MADRHLMIVYTARRKLNALPILHFNLHKNERRKLTLVDKANVLETSRLVEKSGTGD